MISRVETGLLAPIAPSIVVLPVPDEIAKASVSLEVPLIVPSIKRFPAPVPVLIVVVPSVLKTKLPPSNVRLSLAVLTVGLAAVSKIVLPAAAS